MDHIVPMPKPRSVLKTVLLSLLITLAAGAVFYYIRLPALNFKSPDLYVFLFFLLAVYMVSSALLRLGRASHDPSRAWGFLKKNCKIPLLLALLLAVVILVGALSSLVLFRASDYAALLVPEPSDFAADIDQISFDQIPMLDEDSAKRLGDKKLGELSDMVSQFEVADAYAQINYNDRPVRVTHLEYADFFKWLSNRSQGLPAYIYIDMVTQQTNVVRLEEGMKYSPAEYFNRYLYRHLRFAFPTLMFDECTFEIDDEGKPWWICSVVDHTIGLFGGEDVIGAVLVDAVSGQCSYKTLDQIPTWVDRVFSAGLVISQYDRHGMYQGGFLNSLFGQKNCTATTDGYSYLALQDDVWLYTGITSVTSDASNIGFILVNQRTKEARFYPVAGATEHSARSSAEGVVQHLGYRSTFPLLLNLSGQPTYFMALKDNAQLVKMYAMVNVEQYQIVATGSSVAECEQNYIALLQRNGIAAQGSTPSTAAVSGAITDLRSAVIEGTTYYYLQLEGRYYRLSAAESEAVILCDVGDEVTLLVTGSGEIPTAILQP